jgi:formylglycine-generating enzyme required for sulfatase activity
MKRTSSAFRMTAAAFLGIVVSVQSAAGAPARFDSFERDPAFLYGMGTGAAQQDAIDAARADLRAAGLARSLGVEAKDFYVTEDMKKSVILPELKPFVSEKKDGAFRVVLRMPAADWDAYESARRAAIRSELGEVLASIRKDAGMALADRLEASQRIIDRITREGLYAILISPEGGGRLFVRTIEDYCRQVAAGLGFEADPPGGLVEDRTRFTVRLGSKDELSVAGGSIAAEWKTESGASKKVALTAGADGSAELAFPEDSGLYGQAVTLYLSTALAALEPESELFRSLDGPPAAFRFRYFPDIEKAFNDMVRVPGGSFTAGALPQDRKAAKKEAPRAAQVGDFFMDRYPVTNVLYRAYLEVTGAPPSSYPPYIDHPAYGAPDQPVIGVTLEEAGRFAQWVSERTGKRKRLPTEDEWERAARGGADVVFPWGDQSPVQAVLANYNGNGRFDATSPVGSFEGGKNLLGLYDMAGNVWEWTATAADAASGAAGGNATGGGSGNIVKGGSWMDGPNELRVSNRKGLDPSKQYSDVGFRLVMEVGNE